MNFTTQSLSKLSLNNSSDDIKSFTKRLSSFCTNKSEKDVFDTIDKSFRYQDREILALGSLKLTGLPSGKGSWKGMETVKRLCLPDTGITEIPDDLPEELSQIEKLSLGRNKLDAKSIEALFTKFKNLKDLDLEGNNFYLPRKIEKSSKMTRLILSDNKNLLGKKKNKNLPKWLFDITSLRLLCLSGSNIKTLSSDIKKLNQLTQFYLSNNKLESIPNSLGELTNLTYLNLGHNNIHSLPKGFKNLKKLEMLDLRNNKIKNFPLQITELEKLEELWLPNNQLEEIPEEIAKLKDSLKTLSIEGNRFQHFPQIIVTLKNLTMLFVSNNNISNLPSKIGNLEKLTAFSAYNCGISTIPETFQNLVNLEYLDLSDNELDEVPSGFGNFKKLEFLDLQKNKIQWLPTTMIGLDKIYSLNLNENPINVYSKGESKEELRTQLEYLKMNPGNDSLSDFYKGEQMGFFWIRYAFGKAAKMNTMVLYL